MEEHKDDQYCFPDINSSCKKSSLSTPTYITLYIFFSLISAVTIFLNLLVIISISHFKQLHTPTNLLILSLAVVDFLVGLIVIPGLTVAIMEPCWIVGEHFCSLLLYITFFCASSSLGNLVLISVDRYIAVCEPLLYHLKITTSRIKGFIFITWWCCILYDVGVLKIYVNVQVTTRCYEECYLPDGDFWAIMMDFAFTMVVPCSIIITLYLKIFVVARSQARKVYSKDSSTRCGVKTVQATKSERKAAKTLGIVIFNYLIFWNPFLYIYFFTNNNTGAFIISYLPLLSSFVNPIIYALFYPWFKNTVKLILSCKLRR